MAKMVDAEGSKPSVLRDVPVRLRLQGFVAPTEGRAIESIIDYERAASRTAKFLDTLPEKAKLLYLTAQLVAEAGEVAAVIAKATIRGVPVDSIKLRDELGDLEWFWVIIHKHFGLDPEVTLAENVSKLKRRYPDGYSPEADVARRDVA